MIKVKFKNWNCILQKKYYGNDRIALQLIDEYDGAPVAMATVNIPDAHLEEDEVLIKTWSENEGIVEALQSAGVIGEVLGVVPTGFVNATKHKLLI